MTAANTQNLNVQISPGFIAFPPSIHPGIGACDPASYGLLTPKSVPGHPTAVQAYCEGTSEPGKYPSMLWSPKSLLPVPPDYTRLNLDLDTLLGSSLINQGNCLEIDTMTVVDGLTYPAGFHIILAQGGKAQICDPTGAKWLDAGFSIALTPDVLHHFTFQYRYDFARKTLTWLGIVVDGKTNTVQNAVVDADNWKWGDGYKPQLQIDNVPAAPLISGVFDNFNYTWMP